LFPVSNLILRRLDGKRYKPSRGNARPNRTPLVQRLGDFRDHAVKQATMSRFSSRA